MERITGTVSRVNGNGFQLTGRAGWVNISKFAQGVELPSVGAQVAAELDGKGFVRRLEPVGPSGDRSQAGTDLPAVDRETAIGRMAALNTAVAILGGGPGCPLEPGEVVALAERLAAWVRRP